MVVNNIGYTEFAFSQLGAKRAVPIWGPALSTVQMVSLPSATQQEVKALLKKDEAAAIKEAFSRYFMCQISPAESRLYKLTTALGEMHLGDIQGPGDLRRFAGILYPSVRMWANGDNVALLPWFVDNYLEFRKAVHVRIKHQKGSSIDIDYLDAAHGFDDEGKLKWLGRIKKWTLNRAYQEAKFIAKPGPDADGDYSVAQDGIPVHWEATDVQTGEIILPD